MHSPRLKGTYCPTLPDCAVYKVSASHRELLDRNYSGFAPLLAIDGLGSLQSPRSYFGLQTEVKYSWLLPHASKPRNNTVLPYFLLVEEGSKWTVTGLVNVKMH